jgi:hypothetical protein
MTDEERIIQSIIDEEAGRVFDDSDFLATKQSLYINPTNVPEYDGDIFHQIE